MKGKRTLARIKIGVLYAILAWGLLTALNVLLTLYYYGFDGWKAFWQNWVIDWAPFAWNQAEVTLLALITSLAGAIVFSLLILLISASAPSSYISFALGSFFRTSGNVMSSRYYSLLLLTSDQKLKTCRLGS